MFTKPVLVLLAAAVLLLFAVGGYAAILSARLDAAALLVTVEKDRADKAEKDLKEEKEKAKRIEEAMVERDREAAEAEALATRARRAVSVNKGTAGDRAVSKVWKDYLDALRGDTP